MKKENSYIEEKHQLLKRLAEIQQKAAEESAASALAFASENGLDTKAAKAFLCRLCGMTEGEIADALSVRREVIAPSVQGVNPLIRAGFEVILMKDGEKVFPKD